MASDGVPGDEFGAVAVGGGGVLVGAAAKNHGTGAVYYFTQSATPATPAPPSLIPGLIGLVCTGVYAARARLRRVFDLI